MAAGAEGDPLGNGPRECAWHCALERDRESAEVIAQLTAQVEALTTAGEVLDARARWLLVIAIGALAIAVLAIARALLFGP